MTNRWNRLSILCLGIIYNPFRTDVSGWQSVKPQVTTVALNLKITILVRKNIDHILIFSIYLHTWVSPLVWYLCMRWLKYKMAFASEKQNNFVTWGFFLFVCLLHRLLVEKIFAQYLVPHNLETEERMKCLYYLYASLDPNAVK